MIGLFRERVGGVAWTGIVTLKTPDVGSIYPDFKSSTVINLRSPIFFLKASSKLPSDSENFDHEFNARDVQKILTRGIRKVHDSARIDKEEHHEYIRDISLGKYYPSQEVTYYELLNTVREYKIE